MTDAQLLNFLRMVVDMAKQYWDALHEPYPPNLEAAIEFLKERTAVTDDDD